VVVGGRVDAMGSNARLGNSQYLVAEADESDRSFLNLSPILSVVTNIDREHMDCYRNMRDVKRTFVQFMDLVPFYGTVVVCNDDPALRGLLPEVQRRTVTYGTRRGSDLRITAVNSEKMASQTTPLNRFEVRFDERELGEFTLHVPGLHNVLNATAAIAVGLGLDVPVEHIRSGLDHFRGVDRRFQLKGKAAGVTVIDDYGHHPTEIKATLSAARQCGFRKVHVIFQPHRYSRTQALMEEFATAFGDAETIWVLDVYPASEAPIEGVTGEVLAERVRQQSGKDAKYQGSFSEAAQAAVAAAEEGDMILTLGAGNVSQLGPSILEKLQAREAVASR
jgi:UDP-N-acetylmuramate--alanine ligase